VLKLVLSSHPECVNITPFGLLFRKYFSDKRNFHPSKMLMIRICKNAGADPRPKTNHHIDTLCSIRGQTDRLGNTGAIKT